MQRVIESETDPTSIFALYFGGGHRRIDGYVVVDVTISANQNEKGRCGWKPVGLQLHRLTVLRVSRCHGVTLNLVFRKRRMRFKTSFDFFIKVSIT